MRKKVDPQERRWRAYLLTERLREKADDTGDPSYETQAAAIEADYGGWTETDTNPPRPVWCPACATEHPAKYNCPEKRDAYWALLKDKEVPGHIKNYARGALDLDEARKDI